MRLYKLFAAEYCESYVLKTAMYEDGSTQQLDHSTRSYLVQFAIRKYKRFRCDSYCNASFK
jgi:hypothetical protein